MTSSLLTPSPPETRPGRRSRRPRGSLTVFALAVTVYTALGWYLVARLHVVGFDVLDRLDHALDLLHAASGATTFTPDLPPLAVLALGPLVVVPPGEHSLLVVPVASAACAGVLLVALHALLRGARVGTAGRVGVLVAAAANPLLVLGASTGARSVVWLAMLTLGVVALVAWLTTDRVGYVPLAGVAFAAAVLSSYASLVWVLVAAALLVTTLRRRGAPSLELEGTLVAFVAPTVLGLALVTLLSALHGSAPWSWAVETSDAGASVAVSLVDLPARTLGLLIGGAPLALVVLPALLVVAAVRRDLVSGWLAALLLTAVVLPAGSAGVGAETTPFALSQALPSLVLALVGAVWLVGRSERRRTLTLTLLVVVLIASVPWTLRQMAIYPHQGLEARFADAVTTGRDQQNTLTSSGLVVGVADEQAMAGYIRSHVHTGRSIVTDGRRTFAVELFTGRPDLFVPVDARTDAIDAASYVLLSHRMGPDEASARFPDATSGKDAAWSVVFATARYTLVRVPATGWPDLMGDSRTEGGRS
ncbi:hypothetical protein [Nocardioides acrostichi]|uniref:Glycosyltransferase RgtA/B/C/D-like domain-containing protein n=1 Tax=Nocardioides acrostichi TaxID=2784339 RepID=A0A930YDF8_9ACTN|nr:hypothetical protein [Nocardioides acrostichi]MBF4162444.1 hypothetical protein [Nocardioides acrostichi]